jgi:hypothetical protein
MTKKEERETPGREEGRKSLYVPPEIAWEEEYKPAALGVSCAKLPGDLGCVPQTS